MINKSIHGHKWVFFYYILSVMILSNKATAETRGRPRKQETRTLSPVFKQKFSDNSAIIHTSFLIYVFEVFVDTKNEKRVGHKDGGFTLYDKIDNEYCFDSIQSYLGEWRCHALLNSQNLRDFVKLLPALGPKIILKEICEIINFIVQCSNEGQSQNQIFLQLSNKQNEEMLDDAYPYMRFVSHALHELRMDKLDRSSNNLLDLIKQRVNYLWPFLLKIIIHTVINCTSNRTHNKYFKPFFSDAENPSETHIGQLNLDQIVIAVKRHESLQKSSEDLQDQQIMDKPRKMRSFVDVDGTRTVVQIIKAPEALAIEKRNIENVSLLQDNPAKLVRLQSQPVFVNKGFTPIFRPSTLPTSSPKKQTQKKKEGFLGFRPSWKCGQQDQKAEKMNIRLKEDRIEQNENRECELEKKQESEVDDREYDDEQKGMKQQRQN